MTGMTDKTKQQILEKALERANGNSYRGFIKLSAARIIADGYEYNVFFDHDFAKAFWPDDIIGDGRRNDQHSWQYHIQQLALAEDRFKYIEQFLEEE